VGSVLLEAAVWPRSLPPSLADRSACSPKDVSVDVPPVRSSRDRAVGRNKRKADSAASRDDDVERQAKLEQALLQQLDMQKKLHEQLEVPRLIVALLSCSIAVESPSMHQNAVHGREQHHYMFESSRSDCRPAVTCVAGSEAAPDAAGAAPAAHHGHAQGAVLHGLTEAHPS